MIAGGNTDRISPTTTQETNITRPTEISIPPVINTNVSPITAIPKGESCCSMSRILSNVKKLGFTHNNAYRNDFSYRLNNNDIVNYLFGLGYRIGYNR